MQGGTSCDRAWSLGWSLVRSVSWPSIDHAPVMYSGAVADRPDAVPVAVTTVRPKAKVDRTGTRVLANPPFGPPVTLARRRPGNDSLPCSPRLQPGPATL